MRRHKHPMRRRLGLSGLAVVTATLCLCVAALEAAGRGGSAGRAWPPMAPPQLLPAGPWPLPQHQR